MFLKQLFYEKKKNKTVCTYIYSFLFYIAGYGRQFQKEIKSQMGLYRVTISSQRFIDIHIVIYDINKLIKFKRFNRLFC